MITGRSEIYVYRCKKSIKVSPLARIMQPDQSEYVPETTLLKEQFSRCMQVQHL